MKEYYIGLDAHKGSVFMVALNRTRSIRRGTIGALNRTRSIRRGIIGALNRTGSIQRGIIGSLNRTGSIRRGIIGALIPTEGAPTHTKGSPTEMLW
jgi:hypothetical protein